jgi:hypothetical protein
VIGVWGGTDEIFEFAKLRCAEVEILQVVIHQLVMDYDWKCVLLDLQGHVMALCGPQLGQASLSSVSILEM